MTYEEAVTLLKQGNESGFRYLYDTTYKSCLYVIGEIVKDSMEAENILQDAYMNAISKIDTLKNPEEFPSWFKTMATHIAINRVNENNRMQSINPVVDVSPESVMDIMVNEKSASNQITPEEAYECRNTSSLLHELIDELPEKHRQCILLYYMEEYSVKDIANICKCSENTINSRLNYGKQKLEEKTIELQNKGCVLRSITPVYLITWLLKTDMFYKLKFVYGGAATSAFSHTLFTKLINAGFITMVNSELTSAARSGIASVVNSGMTNTVNSGMTNLVNSGMTTASGEAITSGYATVSGGVTTGSAINGSVVAGTAAKGVASTAVKGGIHTLAGKIITGALATVIAGGLVTAGVVTIINNNKTEDEVTTVATSEEITTEVTTENPQDTQATSEEPTTEADDGYTQMTDDDYADLICGGLSMRETEIMFESLWIEDVDIDINISELFTESYNYPYYIDTLIQEYGEELSIEEYDEIYETINASEGTRYEEYTLYYANQLNGILEALQLPLFTTNNYDYWYDLLNAITLEDFEGNGSNNSYVYDIIEDNIVIAPLDGTFFVDNNIHAEIVSGKYNDEEMSIIFKLYRFHPETLEVSPVCEYFNYEEAIFYKNDSGKYYLSELHEYTDTTNNENTNTALSDVSNTWKDSYKDILENDKDWGINSGYFEDTYWTVSDERYFSTEALNTNYENIINTQYALISLSGEDIPYLVIKRTYEHTKDPDAEYDYDKSCILWYIYKYVEGDGFQCFCELRDYTYNDYGYDLNITVYNNELAWYWDYDEIIIYDLCLDNWGGTITEAELTAAKDEITYYDISDTSAIDNY